MTRRGLMTLVAAVAALASIFGGGWLVYNRLAHPPQQPSPSPGPTIGGQSSM
jgi:hypothetical protein